MSKTPRIAERPIGLAIVLILSLLFLFLLMLFA